MPGGTTSLSAPVVQGILATVAGIIREVDKKVLLYKRQISDSIGNVIDGSATIHDYLYLTVTGAVSTVGLLTAVSSMSWATAARAAINTVRTTVATFLDSFAASFLIAGHRVLTFFWADYKALFRGVADAAAGISQSLGMGLEFLPVLLIDAQNVVVAAASIGGGDPDTARFSFLTDAAEWIKRLDDRFSTYAGDPGAILDDLQSSILTYSQRQASIAWTNLSQSVDQARERAETAMTGVDNLIAAVATLVDDLPADAFAELQAYVDPYFEEYFSFRDERLIPALESLETMLDPVTDLVRDQAAKVERNGALILKWPRLITRLIDFSDTVRLRVTTAMTYVLSRIKLSVSETNRARLTRNLLVAVSPAPLAIPQLAELEPGVFTETVGPGYLDPRRTGNPSPNPATLSDGSGPDPVTESLIEEV